MFTVLNHLSPLVTRHPVAARDLYCPVRLVSHTLTLPYSSATIARAHPNDLKNYKLYPFNIYTYTYIYIFAILKCLFEFHFEEAHGRKRRGRDGYEGEGSFRKSIEKRKGRSGGDEIIKSSSRNDPKVSVGARVQST